MSTTSTWEPKPGTVADRALFWLEDQAPGTEVTSSKWAEAIGVETANLIVGVSAAVQQGALERFTKHGQTRPFFYRLPMSAKRRPRAASAIEKPEAPPAPPADPRIDMLISRATPPGPTPDAAAQAPQAATPGTADLRATTPDAAAPSRETKGRVPETNDPLPETGAPVRATAAPVRATAARKPKASSAAAVERAAKDVKQYVRAIHQRTPPDPEPASAASPLVVERFAYWSSGELAFERGAEVIVLPAAVAQQFFAFARRVGEPA